MDREKWTKYKDKARKWVTCSFDIPSSSQNTSEDQKSVKASRKRPRKQQTKSSKADSVADTQSTWLQKFAPKDTKDLAVHPKKVADVASWILDNTEKCHKSTRQYVPMLLLTGPSGSGKTETVKVIAKENGITLSEWVDKTASTSYISWSEEQEFSRWNFEDRAFFPESQTAAFSRFLLQASKYSDIFSSEAGKKAVLIDDFPNTFYRSPSNFHNILRTYAKRCKCPLVFVVTENGKEETFEHELFPRQLQVELGMTRISFNAVAATILHKALNKICDKLQISGMKIPTKLELESVVKISNGDIRTAINTLEMLCTASSTVREIFHKEKLDHESKKALPEHAHDSGIGLFHLLGKVLYCKRSDGIAPHTTEKPPLIEDTEDILTHISVSSEYFILYLHQNFILFTDCVEEAESCLQRISEADIWTADWTVKESWESYSVSHAIRGLMYHLPTRKTRHQWRQTEKPEWFSVNKKIRDNCYTLESSLKGKPYSPTGMNVHGLSLGELTTIQLPFLSINDLTLHNAGILKSLNKVMTFPGIRQIKPWSQSKLIHMETNVCNTWEVQNELLKLSTDDLEDFSIEDADDDL